MKLTIDGVVVQKFREEFGPGWTVDDDRRFWRILGGRRGLQTLRTDAKALDTLCRRVSGNLSDRQFIRHRLRAVQICACLSSVESVARIFSSTLPHFFAKFASELFTEMVDRTELVLEEKKPELLTLFGEIDGRAAVHNKNGPLAGRAAGRNSP